VSLAGAAADLSTIEVPAITQLLARTAADAAAAVATTRDVAPVVAVVDAGGELVHLWRPDSAQVASVGVATDKARTAALFRRPSKDFEDQAAGGRPSALHLAGAVPLQGGMPITVDGQVVGAIGVSGASSAPEDQELAVLGQRAAEYAAAAATQTPAATFFPSQVVREKFATGGLLVDTPGYQVDAGRRTAPGDVELHEDVVDIMHVVEGTARVVAGDATHELAEGDVLVIPNGVPHQFVDVSEPFLYFVAKVETS
jgi:glc operon protein GlcG